MVKSGMTNVGLVVLAIDYPQHSHCCGATTAHSLKGTTDTQLMIFESLCTPPVLRYWDLQSIPQLEQLAIHHLHSCNSTAQHVHVL